jgi:hypothetical protein
MHTCKRDGCSRPVFGGGYCFYDQWMRVDSKNKPLQPRSHSKRSDMLKQSKRRLDDQKYYTQNCKELEQEIREKNNGKIYDFFSGQEITGRPTWHHWYGRSGDWYTDKRGLVPVINEYHLMYHNQAVAKLEEQEWYSDFLIRLKSFDYSLWEKQVDKKHKSERIISRDLFGD